MIPRGSELALRQALRQVRGVRGSLSRALQPACLTPEQRAVGEAARVATRMLDEALVGLLQGEQERRRREAMEGRAA